MFLTEEACPRTCRPPHRTKPGSASGAAAVVQRCPSAAHGPTDARNVSVELIADGVRVFDRNRMPSASGNVAEHIFTFAVIPNVKSQTHYGLFL
jgi:hypothetical protein